MDGLCEYGPPPLPLLCVPEGEPDWGLGEPEPLPDWGEPEPDPDPEAGDGIGCGALTSG